MLLKGHILDVPVGWRCFTLNLMMYLHESFNKYQLVRHLALWVGKESW